MDILKSEEYSEETKSNEIYDFLADRIKLLLREYPNNTWGNVNVTQFLSDSQLTQLAGTESDSGFLCLLKMWFGVDDGAFQNEIYCGTVWDNVYCWPPTPAGTITRRRCSEVLQNVEQFNIQKIQGYATRQCLSNGTWSRGIRTNYSECAKALMASENNKDDENLTVFVQYMVFIGSIISLLCLGIALTILCSFRTPNLGALSVRYRHHQEYILQLFKQKIFTYRNVWNERIKVHVHLMLSLVLRFVVFLIISEPFVLKRSSSYRDNNFLCKTVLIAHLYATVTSTSWMLVQGIYLNGKLTTNIFGFARKGAFKKFYLIGWALPVILLGIYVIAMIASQHPEGCWQGYAGMKEIWILLVPMKAEMMFNGLLLCNILRIVVTKRRVTSGDSEFAQIKSIAKVTLWLFPILGLNNLLFLYNPGGDYETIYVSLNITLGSTQGIPVAIVYLFNCTEVHDAIRRSYKRFVTRRSFINVSLFNTTQIGMVIMRVPQLNEGNGNENGVENNAEKYV